MTNPICNFPTIALELDAKDADLQKQINSEVTARTDADAQLQVSIDSEVTARTAADKDLQEQLTKEVAARVDSDKVLQKNIDVEAKTRNDADKLLQTQIDFVMKYLVPVGAIEYFARKSAPEGWLKADGSAVSRAQYANLFAAVGTLFGKGDGSTTFNLPDLRGEFIRSLDDGKGIDSGRILGSFQNYNTNMPSGSLYTTASATGNFARGADYNGSLITYGGPVVGSAIETRPRNVALLACIKY